MSLIQTLAMGFVSLTTILSRAGAIVAALILVGMICHTLLEITLRSMFSTSTFALDEYVGYAVAATTVLGAAYALQSGSLIRVTLLFPIFARHPRFHRMLDTANALLAGAIVSAIAVYFLHSVLRHISRGTVSETVTVTPLWIPEALVLVGLILLALRFFALAIEIAMEERIGIAVHATEQDNKEIQGT